mmetsp:Transcript_23460/g.59912  ORF Transcript_23460/g.59912 Transcript_23460/m.59912 type:complete len:102 (-) Transcript_23460:329-634(-)
MDEQATAGRQRAAGAAAINVLDIDLTTTLPPPSHGNGTPDAARMPFLLLLSTKFDDASGVPLPAFPLQLRAPAHTADLPLAGVAARQTDLGRARLLPCRLH